MYFNLKYSVRVDNDKVMERSGWFTTKSALPKLIKDWNSQKHNERWFFFIKQFDAFQNQHVERQQPPTGAWIQGWDSSRGIETGHRSK